MRAFLAGGVPEVMLHLRALGLLDLSVLHRHRRAARATCSTWWETSERRQRLRERLFEQDGVDPDDVIMSPAEPGAGTDQHRHLPARQPRAEGSVIKSTAIDPTRGRPRRGLSQDRSRAGLHARERGDRRHQGAGGAPDPAGRRPRPDRPRPDAGPGWRRSYQITSALQYLSFGKHVAVLTDARFSGVSTGACIGHVSPEALAGGPIGKLRDGDLIRIVVDRVKLEGSLDLVGAEGVEFGPERRYRVLTRRSPHSAALARPRPARRHPALGGLAGRRRRHLGRLRLRHRRNCGRIRGQLDPTQCACSSLPLHLSRSDC